MADIAHPNPHPERQIWLDRLLNAMNLTVVGESMTTKWLTLIRI